MTKVTNDALLQSLLDSAVPATPGEAKFLATYQDATDDLIRQAFPITRSIDCQDFSLTVTTDSETLNINGIVCEEGEAQELIGKVFAMVERLRSH